MHIFHITPRRNDPLAQQIESEGIDWLQRAIGTAIFVALVLLATFCHHEVSHAQGVDPMPMLRIEYHLPLISNQRNQ